MKDRTLTSRMSGAHRTQRRWLAWLTVLTLMISFGCSFASGPPAFAETGDSMDADRGELICEITDADHVHGDECYLPVEDSEPEETAGAEVADLEPEEIAEADVVDPEPDGTAEADVDDPEPEETAEAEVADLEPEEIAEADVVDPESEGTAEADVVDPEPEETAEADVVDPEPEETTEADVIALELEEPGETEKILKAIETEETVETGKAKPPANSEPEVAEPVEPTLEQLSEMAVMSTALAIAEPVLSAAPAGKALPTIRLMTVASVEPDEVVKPEELPLSPLTQDPGETTPVLRATGNDGFTEGTLTVSKVWQNKDGSALAEPGAESVFFTLYRYSMADVSTETISRTVTFDSESTPTSWTLDVPVGEGIVVSWTYRSTPVYESKIKINGEKYTLYPATYVRSGLDASLTIPTVQGNIEITLQDGVAATARSVSLYSGSSGTTVYSKTEIVQEGVELNAGNGWTKTWTVSDTAQAENVLTHTDGNGAKYYYFVEEEPVQGFDTSYDPDGPLPADRARQSGAITLTNRSTTQLTDVVVTKSFSGVESLPAEFQIMANLTKTDAASGETEDLGARVLKLSGTQSTGVILPQTGGTDGPQYTWTIHGLKAGTVVTLTEENADVDGTVMKMKATSNTHTGFSSSGLTAVVQAVSTVGGQAPSQVDLVNSYTLNPGSLSLTKTVQGDDAETDRGFAFRIVLVPPEGSDGFMQMSFPASLNGVSSGNYNGSIINGGALQGGVTLKHGETYTVTGLPAGTGFVITETDYSSDRYSMSITGDGSLIGGEIRGTVRGGTVPNTAVTVINTRAPAADLQILKQDSENGSPLAGAEFSLRTLDPTNVSLKTLEGSAERSATTDSNGTAVFSELIDGIYELCETVAPEGYILSGEVKAYFRVENGSLSMLTPSVGTAPGTWTAGESAGGTQISFTPATEENQDSGDAATPATALVLNTAGIPMPATGGIGTTQFTVIGCVILLAGVIGIVLRKRE